MHAPPPTHPPLAKNNKIKNRFSHVLQQYPCTLQSLESADLLDKRRSGSLRLKEGLTAVAQFIIVYLAIPPSVISSVESLDWLGGRGGGGMSDASRDPLPVFSAGDHCEQSWPWTGASSLWRCLSRISSSDYGVAHSPRCLEGWFWRGWSGVWHARIMWVSVSWQLPEEVPVDPQKIGLALCGRLWC